MPQSARWRPAPVTSAARRPRASVHPTNDHASNGGSVAAMRAASRRNPVTPIAARRPRIARAAPLRSRRGPRRESSPRRPSHACEEGEACPLEEEREGEVGGADEERDELVVNEDEARADEEPGEAVEQERVRPARAGSSKSRRWDSTSPSTRRRAGRPGRSVPRRWTAGPGRWPRVAGQGERAHEEAQRGADVEGDSSHAGTFHQTIRVACSTAASLGGRGGARSARPRPGPSPRRPRAAPARGAAPPGRR